MIGIALIALPALLGPLLFVPGLRRPAAALAPWAALPILIWALLAPIGTRIFVPWLLFNARFEFDALAGIFLSFSAITWLLAGLYIRATRDDPELQLFHLLAITGNFGLILAGDIVTFYSCFSLMSFAGYGLVIHERSDKARRAARIYIIFTVVGEVMLFAGFITAQATSEGLAVRELTAAIAESPNAARIATLLFVGAGIKAGALALHMWLPLAHAAAPTPASAVLSSAMISAGLFGWLRLLPLGLIALPSLGAVVMGLGITAAFYGVVVGTTQRDAKTILAYSSISQMGLMTLAVGVALTQPDSASVAIAAAALFAFHHGLTKAGLFLAVGITHHRLGRHARLIVGVAIVLLALSIAGLPLSTGAIAKHALKAAVHDAPGPWREPLTLLLSLSSAATLVLMLRFLARLRIEAGSERQPASLRLTLPWGLGAVLALVCLWVLAWFDAPTLANETLEPSALWSSTWPAVLGLVLYFGVSAIARRRAWRLPNIPPGDLVVPIERALAAINRVSRRAIDALDKRLPRERIRSWRAWVLAASHGLIAREHPSGWTSGAMLLAVLLTLLAILVGAGWGAEPG